jgi:protein ImuA
MNMNHNAALLLSHQLWRARDSHAVGRARISSGFAELNIRTGGGWPRGELSELLSDQPGSGRLSLLLPALSDLSQSGLGVAFIAAPQPLYAPALAQAGVDLARTVVVQPNNPLDAQWAAEELLRNDQFGAVVLWLNRSSERELRRLKLAVEKSGQLGLLLRPLAAQQQTSPAALRLQVQAANGIPQVKVLKARGIHPGAPFALPSARAALLQRALRKPGAASHRCRIV